MTFRLYYALMYSSHGFQECVNRFLEFMKAEENKSPLTIENYRQSFEFMRYMMPVKTVFDINRDAIRAFKLGMYGYESRKGKQLSVRTRNHYLMVLRSFLRYLIREEEQIVMPPDSIRLLRGEDRQVKVMASDEVERLVTTPDMSTPQGKRDRAILEMLYSTGMRVQELRSLNRDQLNFHTNELTIRGKRGKVRLVFLSESAFEAVYVYLKTRKDSYAPLFIRPVRGCDRPDERGENLRLSRISLYNIVKKYASKARIVTDPSPHTLRHTFATDLLRNGADLRSIQEMLGHKFISTTQIYTHVSNPRLNDIHRKFHRSRKI